MNILKLLHLLMYLCILGLSFASKLDANEVCQRIQDNIQEYAHKNEEAPAYIMDAFRAHSCKEQQDADTVTTSLPLVEPTIEPTALPTFRPAAADIKIKPSPTLDPFCQQLKELAAQHKTKGQEVPEYLKNALIVRGCEHMEPLPTNIVPVSSSTPNPISTPNPTTAIIIPSNTPTPCSMPQTTQQDKWQQRAKTAESQLAGLIAQQDTWQQQIATDKQQLQIAVQELSKTKQALDAANLEINLLKEQITENKQITVNGFNVTLDSNGLARVVDFRTAQKQIDKLPGLTYSKCSKIGEELVNADTHNITHWPIGFWALSVRGNIGACMQQKRTGRWVARSIVAPGTYFYLLTNTE